MGKVMSDIYEAVKKIDGVRGGMRLAMITGITGDMAVKNADTPEAVKKMAAAYKEITSKDCPSSLLGGMI